MWRSLRSPSGARPNPADWLAALLLHMGIAAALLWHAERTHPLLPPPSVEVRIVVPSSPKPPPAPKKLASEKSEASRPRKAAGGPPSSRKRPSLRRTRPKEEPFDLFQPLVAPAAPASSAPPASAKAALPVSSSESPEDQKAQVLSAAEIAGYLARMRAAIERVWRPPPVLGPVRDPLVELRLAPNGEIKSVRILESSGSAALDASLLRAIQKAAPFALPQQGYEAFAVNRIRFHPKR